jgi:hypothetical protein
MKVLAGDFKNKACSITTKNLIVDGFLSKEKIPLADIAAVDIEAEESKTSGGLGTAAVGGLLFGGAGAIVGAIAGRGSSTDTTASVTLLDGRRFMAKFTSSEMSDIRAALFEIEGKSLEQRNAESEARKAKRKRNETIVAWVVVIAIAAAFLAYRMN